MLAGIIASGREILKWFFFRCKQTHFAAPVHLHHDLRQRAMRDQGRYDVPVLPGVRYRRAHHMCVPPLSHVLVPFLRLFLFSHSPSRTAHCASHRTPHHTSLLRPPPRLPPATHHHIPATHHHNAPVFSSPLASVTAHPCFFVCGRLVLQLRRTRPRRPDAEPRPRVARGHRLRPPLDTPRMVVPAMRVHRPRDTAEALG